MGMVLGLAVFKALVVLVSCCLSASASCAVVPVVAGTSRPSCSRSICCCSPWAGVPDRKRRPVAGAGRLPRGHADLGNRIPLSGGRRHQAFRDVLLGLFFVTIGMLLDLKQVMLNWGDVLLLVAAIVIGKTALVGRAGQSVRSTRPTAVRTALGWRRQANSASCCWRRRPTSNCWAPRSPSQCWRRWCCRC